MPRCPDIELLRRLEAGECDDTQADRVLAHLEKCRSCAETTERIRSQDLDGRVLRRACRKGPSDEPRSEPVVGGDTPGTDQGPGQAWDIPDYQRERLCGEGAFGTVWAVCNRVGVYRALKVIDLGRLRSANARCRETTALEAYCRHVEAHPNLIDVFHVGVRGNLLYYTMELADDYTTRKPVRARLPETYRPMTLRRVIGAGPIAPDTAIEVVLRLLRGLSRLHALDMAHRDIKPANIVFVNRQPKLSDIGMITADTASPSNVGTPDYMPPDEQMDLTADTYALGRILHELMAGGRRNDSPTLPVQVIAKSENWDMESVQCLLAKACAPGASDRFQHAEQMREAIEACRLWSYDSLFAESDAPGKVPVQRRRSPYVPILVAAIGALPWVLGLVLAIVLVGKLL